MFDPCCGSGAHCKVAKENRRHYIGVEIDPDYYKIASTNVNIMEDNYERKNINSRNANYINQAI